MLCKTLLKAILVAHMQLSCCVFALQKKRKYHLHPDSQVNNKMCCITNNSFCKLNSLSVFLAERVGSSLEKWVQCLHCVAQWVWYYSWHRESLLVILLSLCVQAPFTSEQKNSVNHSGERERERVSVLHLSLCCLFACRDLKGPAAYQSFYCTLTLWCSMGKSLFVEHCCKNMHLLQDTKRQGGEC